MAIVHKRSPFIQDATLSSRAIAQRIPPLEVHETQLLLTQILHQNNLSVQSQSTVSEVTEFLDGYPPSAYFAGTYAAEYGLSALAADTAMLVDFKAKRFNRFVSDLKLTDTEWLIMRYLCSERQLPLEAISVATDQSREATAGAIRNLIDHSLVVVVDEKYSGLIAH